MTYLKGIYYALRGQVEMQNFDCRPTDNDINVEEFSNRVSRDYSDALELIAE